MAMLQFIRSLLIKAKVEGAAQAKTDLEGLAAGQERVSKTSDESAKKQLSIAQAFERTERRFNSQIKAQYEYEKVQKTVNRAVAQNPALQDRANAVLADARKHFDGAATGSRAFGAALNEMQGSAMALAGNLGGLGGILIRLGPMGLAAGAALGAITLGLNSIRNGVNDLADASGKMVDFSESIGLTTKEIRALEAAGAMVGVEAAKITTGFEKFAVELNDLRDGSGRLFNELIKVNPELVTQLGNTKTLAEAWDVLARSMSQAGDAAQKAALARAAFGRGGVGMGRVLEQSRQAGGLQGLTEQRSGALDDFGDEARARWDANADKIAEKARQVREGFFSMFADDIQQGQLHFWTGLEFITMKLQGVENAAEKIRKAAAKPVGGATPSGDGSTISMAELQALQTQSVVQGEINQKLELAKRLKAEAEGMSQREAAAVLALANSYQGLTVEQAKTVQGYREQEALAGAVTGQARMLVQEEQTIAQLLRQGATLYQAQAVAAAQRAAAVAAANAQAGQTLQRLEEEYELLKAGSEEEERRIKARQTYDRLVADGVDSQKASAVAAQQLANEEERASQAADETAQNVGKINFRMAQANQAVDDFNARWERNLALVNEVNEQLKYTGVESAVFNPRTGDILQMPDTSNLFRSNQGGLSQFNPGGYTSELTQFAFENKTIEDSIQKMFTEGKSIQEIFQAALSDPSLANQVKQLFSDQEQYGAVSQQLAIAQSGPRTLENELLIKQLTEELNRLSESSGALTSSTDSLNSTMAAGLSQLYSADPRTTKIGFRAGAMGNPDWLLPGYGADNPFLGVTGNYGTEYGGLDPLAFTRGFAEGGSFVVPGGYSAGDNRMVSFPAASGETVSVSRDGGGGSNYNDNRIIINGNVDQGVMDRVKVTQFQQAQRSSKFIGMVN
jgi:hypothetical protein